MERLEAMEEPRELPATIWFVWSRSDGCRKAWRYRSGFVKTQSRTSGAASCRQSVGPRAPRCTGVSRLCRRAAQGFTQWGRL